MIIRELLAMGFSYSCQQECRKGGSALEKKSHRTLCVKVLFLGCWVTETFSLILVSYWLLVLDAVPGMAHQSAVLFQE